MLLHESGDVGERPKRQDVDAAGVSRVERLAQPGHGIVAYRRCQRVGESDAAKPVIAVDVGGIKPLARQRPSGTRDDRHVDAAFQRQDAAGVTCRRCDADIAGNGRDALDLELRRLQCEQDRHRIVDAGIGVDDNRAGGVLLHRATFRFAERRVHLAAKDAPPLENCASAVEPTPIQKLMRDQIKSGFASHFRVR